MGLASALTTALTGLNAAETQIDVVGNNLANSQTIGFKSSDIIFVTQFLQTQSLGSAPTGNDGGTNPRQTGLGVRVGEISPDFSQGTIEVSASPSDLAVQGDGFFMVQGSQGDTLYTRNGVFKTNASNQLVTTTGNLVLGFGRDSDDNIVTELAPLEIPLGDEVFAKATTSVTLQGILTPTGDVATAAEVIQSAILGDGIYDRPDITGTTATPSGAAGLLSGNYDYLITFRNSGSGLETRPSVPLGPIPVVNGEIDLAGLPAVPAGFDQVRIYRNTTTDNSTYYLTGTVPGGTPTFTDTRADSDISDLTVVGNLEVDLDGPRIGYDTLLVDVLRRDGLEYENVFEEGTLSFQARKGGRLLAAKELVIDGDPITGTTVQDLLDFMEEAMGIQDQGDDPNNVFPSSANNIEGESGTLVPEADITPDGQIRIVGNNGVDNALEVGLSSFRITRPDNTTVTTNLGFSSIQDAVGESAVADFIAYDSLGVPINVRITAVLESVTGSATTYRWFADSADNDGAGEPDVEINVGTGLVTFDGEGNLIGSPNATVTIGRSDIPSIDPLEFTLDFATVSGLSADSSLLVASRQDGSAPGVLTSYVIGEDGLIRGVFSNGITRELGQVRLARFANPGGLVQVGQTMFAKGINSGLPLEGNPNENGLGKIIAGAKELSNTDIGRNMIDLVLATTQYRGNTRVISTAQQLLDELMNLRR